MTVHDKQRQVIQLARQATVHNIICNQVTIASWTESHCVAAAASRVGHFTDDVVAEQFRASLYVGMSHRQPQVQITSRRCCKRHAGVANSRAACEWAIIWRWRRQRRQQITDLAVRFSNVAVFLPPHAYPVPLPLLPHPPHLAPGARSRRHLLRNSRATTGVRVGVATPQAEWALLFASEFLFSKAINHVLLRHRHHLPSPQGVASAADHRQAGHQELTQRGQQRQATSVKWSVVVEA